MTIDRADGRIRDYCQTYYIIWHENVLEQDRWRGPSVMLSDGICGRYIVGPVFLQNIHEGHGGGITFDIYIGQVLQAHIFFFLPFLSLDTRTSSSSKITPDLTLHIKQLIFYSIARIGLASSIRGDQRMTPTVLSVCQSWYCRTRLKQTRPSRLRLVSLKASSIKLKPTYRARRTNNTLYIHVLDRTRPGLTKSATVAGAQRGYSGNYTSVGQDRYGRRRSE